MVGGGHSGKLLRMVRTVTDQTDLRFRLEPVGLEFVEHAPATFRFSATVGAPVGAIFDRLADASSWPQWFPSLKSSEYVSAPPHGVGSKRMVSLAGGGRFAETILAFDSERRYTWRVDSTNAPVFRALVEDWTIEPNPEGTSCQVRWRFAYTPRTLFRAMSPLAPTAMGRVFRAATTRLERQVRSV